jgi:hypothetical protein
MTQTQPSTEWKPQPGKPAMTRDEKTLVTDLEGKFSTWLWSNKLQRRWELNGVTFNENSPGFYLVKPTAAILAAHGIDADGKPVAKVSAYACPWCRKSYSDHASVKLHYTTKGPCYDEYVKSLPGSLEAIADLCDSGRAKLLSADGLSANLRAAAEFIASAAPTTRVNDRWFQAACAAMTGLIAAHGDVYATLEVDASDAATRLMAEVAKREGR